MFIETSLPAAFGEEIVVQLTLPTHDGEMMLPAVVRWTDPDGIGVQFRAVGARETHAITEIVKAHESQR
jgi:type IV pilus assembly protein PilZ